MANNPKYVRFNGALYKRVPDEEVQKFKRKCAMIGGAVVVVADNRQSQISNLSGEYKDRDSEPMNSKTPSDQQPTKGSVRGIIARAKERELLLAQQQQKDIMRLTQEEVDILTK